MLSWREQGSIGRGDWVFFAVLVPLLLATVLLCSDVSSTTVPLLAAVGALAGLSLWNAASVAWSPVPALARDESLLVSLYATSLALPAFPIKKDGERLAVVGLAAAAAGLLAVGAAVQLVRAASADDFVGSRLTFPVSYVNANAAVFLVGFWGAVALASHRPLAVPWRTLSLGAAGAILAAWLTTQSKGAGIALAASAVVVLALSPARLRLLLAASLPLVLVAVAYRPLTAPFRTATEAELADAGREAGRAILVVFAVSLALGLAYALADRRASLPPWAHRAAEVTAAAALAAAVLVAAAVFLVRVDEPADFVADKWRAFKTPLGTETGGSHFVNLGSNRYDFWRVELEGFREHPVAGIGGRGFAVEYRLERESVEAPARGHSLPLDVLLETGIVGFALLAAALGALLVGLARRAGTVAGVAALGGFSYLLVHASGDWVWTFPAVVIPVLALAGTALSGGGVRLPRPVVLAAAAVAAVAALAAVPPLLADRITTAALERGDPSALDTARTLDPLAVEPWLAELAFARTPEERIAALRGALERDPSSPSLHVLLGQTLIEAGRRQEGIAELERAVELDPRGEDTRAAAERGRRGAPLP